MMNKMNKKNELVTGHAMKSKEYNACIQELLSLSTVLQNLEDGFLSTNKMLLK